MPAYAGGFFYPLAPPLSSHITVKWSFSILISLRFRDTNSYKATCLNFSYPLIHPHPLPPCGRKMANSLTPLALLHTEPLIYVNRLSTFYLRHHQSSIAIFFPVLPPQRHLLYKEWRINFSIPATPKVCFIFPHYVLFGPFFSSFILLYTKPLPSSRGIHYFPSPHHVGVSVPVLHTPSTSQNPNSSMMLNEGYISLLPAAFEFLFPFWYTPSNSRDLHSHSYSIALYFSLSSALAFY